MSDPFVRATDSDVYGCIAHNQSRHETCRVWLDSIRSVNSDDAIDRYSDLSASAQ